MQCPACNHVLKEMFTQKGVVVDTCAACEGVWLDGGEIYDFSRDPAKLDNALQQHLAASHASSRSCPRCAESLNTVPFLQDDLPVEVCPTCQGMWFDKGELHKALSNERHLQDLESDKAFREPPTDPLLAAESVETDTSRQQRLQAIALGLTPLPNLFLRSASVFVLLYGLLTLALIIVIEQGFLSASVGVGIAVTIVVLQFVFGPWIMDLTLRWLYKFSWVNVQSLPDHLRDFVKRVCQEQKMRVPRFGIIHDGAPNAFTYGHTPNNMRIVLTQGIFDLLEPEEIEAVTAHEIGHGKHWDILLMTIAQLVPLLLYYAYRMLIQSKRSSGGEKKDGGGGIWIAIGVYIAYIISQYLVLWFSRTREYHADRFAGRVTNNPNAVASALVKVAYGLAARTGSRPDLSGEAGREEQEQRAARTRALGALGIFDAQAAERLVVSAADGSDDNQIHPENLKSAMQWDLWNPWAKWYELNSTHPLVANRLHFLGEQAASLGQEPYVVFDRRQPESYWDEFFVDASIMVLPWVFLLLGVGISVLLWLTGVVPSWWGLIGPPLMGISAGGLIRMLFSYHNRFFLPSTVARLLHHVKVSAVRPVPAKVRGEIIGRGVPGLVWSEDFVMRDKTGILFLDYRQPLWIWDWVFGLLRAGQYIGKKVEVTGWYRRSPAPYLEISSITEEGGKKRHCYTRIAGLVGSLGLFVVAVILLLVGFALS